jgi:valyl-tRNA synthetase
LLTFAPTLRPKLCTYRNSQKLYCTIAFPGRAGGPRKPSLHRPLAPAYDPKEVEDYWYQWWESEGYFKATEEATSRFTMVLPPPNVTGSLHIGHALAVSVEDSLVRWARMSGHQTLWIPGLDHAGIATQAVVEKHLHKIQHVTRHELGREAFVREVWRWKAEFASRIITQLRRTGASADWSRLQFTLDENYSHAVTEAFVRLHRDDLIYRDTRFVHWCPTLRTVLSDIEVDYSDLSERTRITLPGRSSSVEFGVLYRLKYPVVRISELSAHMSGDVSLPLDSSLSVEVCTTRPETLLADTALAVHPADPRYSHLLRDDVVAVNPITHLCVPIVRDATLVDPHFGSGVVKVTPAHDANDFACARRHGLRVLNILTESGAVDLTALLALPDKLFFGSAQKVKAHLRARYHTQDRFAVRQLVLEELRQRHLLTGEQNHAMRLALCSRSGDVLEPLLKPQWYIRSAPLAQCAVQLVRDGDMTIHPSEFVDEWFRWLEHPQDWCVSRQLWWGHRIPAWYLDNGEDVTHGESDAEWFIASSDVEAQRLAAERYGTRAVHLTRDADVLDTWFSSGLYPLVVCGWPHTVDMRFYPLTVLETGHDILFFWVARMVMLCSWLFGRDESGDSRRLLPPFRHVLLHAVVRDAQGRKMSKSLGNVIDPLELIEGTSLTQLLDKLHTGNLDPREIQRATHNLRNEFPNGIPQCGTDALRFALVAYTQQPRSINMEINQVVATRHFCNKLWQACRYVLGHLRAGGEYHLVHTFSSSHNNLNVNFDTALSHRALPIVVTVGERVHRLEAMDVWILHRFAEVVQHIHSAWARFELASITHALYSFFLNDFCDVYIEYSKILLNFQNRNDAVDEGRQYAVRTLLFSIMETMLRLLHPFMPFITEELWQRIVLCAAHETFPPSLMKAPYPLPSEWQLWHAPSLQRYVQTLLDIVHAVRSERKQLNLQGALRLHVWTTDELCEYVIRREHALLERFCKISNVEVHYITMESLPSLPIPTTRSIVRTIHTQCKISIPIEETLLNVNVAEELAKLTKLKVQLETRLSSLQKQMESPDYHTKAPPHVQEKNRQKLKSLQYEIAQLSANVEKLQASSDFNNSNKS